MKHIEEKEGLPQGARCTINSNYGDTAALRPRTDGAALTHVLLLAT